MSSLCSLWIDKQYLPRVLALKTRIQRQFCVDLDVQASPEDQACGLCKVIIHGDLLDRNRAVVSNS